MNWTGGVIGGIFGAASGFLCRMFILAVFIDVPSFGVLLTRTLIPISGLDLVRLFVVVLPFTLMGAILGIVYSRRPEV